ncbi:MAG TPA: radical SAM protein [Gemmatimonadota bacterium]|nr:radical SAM protein [Gemmatimonadota bacterium]
MPLRVNEIFHSIQGESTHAGRPCVFVRLTYCNLRCRYCDTEYAFFEGIERPLDDIVSEVGRYGCRLVEVTGGEPLIQRETIALLERLLDAGHEVLLETSGAWPIENVPDGVRVIMDLKTPGSGMVAKNRWENLRHLDADDEIKFVICDRGDYEWARGVVGEHGLGERHTVLFSPSWGEVDPRELAEWILVDRLPVRLQLQIHKHIWSPTARGV